MNILVLFIYPRVDIYSIIDNFLNHCSTLMFITKDNLYTSGLRNHLGTGILFYFTRIRL